MKTWKIRCWRQQVGKCQGRGFHFWCQWKKTGHVWLQLNTWNPLLPSFEIRKCQIQEPLTVMSLPTTLSWQYPTWTSEHFCNAKLLLAKRTFQVQGLFGPFYWPRCHLKKITHRNLGRQLTSGRLAHAECDNWHYILINWQMLTLLKIRLNNDLLTIK